MDLWRLPPAELLSRLETTPEGLSRAEAAARLGRIGRNVIERRGKKNYVREYLVQYTQFFALLLEVAAFLSFVANYYAPGEGFEILGYAIAGAVVVNASFAFWQEYKADRTVEALLKLVPRLARVRRGNELMKVAVHVLVPGDILFIEAGDRIGADAVLLEDHSLYVNIATLTGESRPVQRSAGSDGAGIALDAKNIVFAGTTVVSGNGTAIVYATGGETEFGRIATLTSEVTRRLTPMQLEVIRITRILTIAALLVGAVFFVLGFLAGEGFLIAAIFALSLIVANVPEGMLPTITLSLSLASQRMARRNALIKNLDSVQTLGSATVICTDKTGTITLNEMTLKEAHLTSGEKVVFTGEGYLEDGEFSIEPENPGSRERLASFMEAAMKNCTAKIQDESVFGDPTELAILAAARKADITPECRPEHRQYPFTSERKMMSTVFAHDGRKVIFTKGALEVLLPLSVAWVGADGNVEALGDAERQQMVERAEALERQAYRVLAVARAEGEEERDLVMLGLVAITDLPRPEVKDAIARCLSAGIRVMMLTGDNPLTAAAIAESIGLPVDCVLTGQETRSLSDERLSELLREKDVLFARMRSEQKLRIATLLQQNGEVVAMTGDGVNDAPALRKADIGISMGIKGTEVAKEAADMILLDDNFASIVSAVEEGRTVYFNIKKFVTYILSSNIPEIVPYILFFFLRIPLPLSVIQILSIDLGSDMLPGLALGSEPPENDIMNRPPVGRDERILDREVFKRGYFFLGLIEGAAAMSAFLGFLFLMGWQYGELPIDPELHRQAMTMTLLGAISCQLVNVWTLRSWENAASGRDLLSNRLLIVAIVLEFLWIFALLNVAAVQAVFNTAAVPAPFLLLLVPFPVLLFASHEYYKYRLRRKRAGPANPAP